MTPVRAAVLFVSLLAVTACGSKPRAVQGLPPPTASPGGPGGPGGGGAGGGGGGAPPGGSIAPKADVAAEDPHAAGLNRALRHRYAQ